MDPGPLWTHSYKYIHIWTHYAADLAESRRLYAADLAESRRLYAADLAESRRLEPPMWLTLRMLGP
jgi:hypothetical protein